MRYEAEYLLTVIRIAPSWAHGESLVRFDGNKVVLYLKAQ